MQFAVQPSADGSTLSLSGDLDSSAVERLEAQLEALAEAVTGTLTLDITHLDYLNSMGIRSFLRLDKLLKANGASIVFKGASWSIFRNFRYCGLDSYFKFTDPDLASLQRLQPNKEQCTAT